MVEKKKGRPPLDVTAKFPISIRLYPDTKIRLDELTNKLCISRTEVIRYGIDRVYEHELNIEPTQEALRTEEGF